VRECAVIARDDVNLQKRLVAYVVAEQEWEPNAGELRNYLREKLPEYMVPSAYAFLGEFPLTSNGKLDRRALPDPDNLRPDREQDYVAPRNEIEKTIVAIWQSVLNVERVGVNDSFFDLGGHSLLLIRVQQLVKDSFEKPVSIMEMFEYPTIAALAEHLSRKDTEQPTFGKVNERARKQKQALARKGRLVNKAKPRRRVSDEDPAIASKHDRHSQDYDSLDQPGEQSFNIDAQEPSASPQLSIGPVGD
jgi:acyl carrier protein